MTVEMALEWGVVHQFRSPQVRRHVGESQPLQAVLEPDDVADVVGSLDVGDRRLFRI